VSIGRALLARTPADKRDDTIFDIVHQLNRGAELLVSPEERREVAGLNLIAASAPGRPPPMSRRSLFQLRRRATS